MRPFANPPHHDFNLPAANDGEAQTVAAEPAPLALVNQVADRPDPIVGAQVGSFRITRKLGHGGMGAVYLGEHPTIGSKVAIKFLHPALTENPSIVRRFYSEARAANIASHEHIVRVLDLGHLPACGYYIVMEYVEGQTLTELLQGKPQPLAFAGEVMMQLCEALDQAHQRGVVHRDLKPDNVLVVERRGQPFIKVADFGIAKLVAERTTLGGGATQAGTLLGTPEYMSPEQCEGREVDARSDIYALGVIAYQLVTGRLPFSGKGVAALLVAHLRHQPPSPKALRPELPPAWEGLILRALSKNPAERFPDVRALAAAVGEAGRAVVNAAVTPPPARSSSEGVQLEVELVRGSPSWIMRAVQVTRAGAFICFAGQPPALQSRVNLRFPSPDGGIAAVGEVVRHVGVSEAQAWNMEPGFAVQFVSPNEALRAHLQRLASERAAPPVRVLSPSSTSLLDRYCEPASTHYEVLDVSPGAGRATILARAKAVQTDLGALRERHPSLSEARKLEAAGQRVHAALAVLGDPRERLAYDASIGNFQGVAAALFSGLSRSFVEGEHARLSLQRPEVEVQVGIHLARAKIARTRGNVDAAIQELERALTLDPLNLTLHDARMRLTGVVP